MCLCVNVPDVGVCAKNYIDSIGVFALVVDKCYLVGHAGPRPQSFHAFVTTVSITGKANAAQQNLNMAIATAGV